MLERILIFPRNHGHLVKRRYLFPQIRLESNSQERHGVAADYKKLRYSQRFPLGPPAWCDNA